MNSLIHPLQPHELVALRGSEAVRRRFLKAYELMLDFYGFAPSSTGSFDRTGAIELVSVPRLKNLISSTHNYLRVTRILKSMGEFGYEHLKLGLVLALWRESRGERGTQYMKRSCDEYWSAVLRDARDREVVALVRQGRVSVKQQEEYVDVLTRRADERARESEAQDERKGESEMDERERSAPAPRKTDAKRRKQEANEAKQEKEEEEQEEEESKAVAESDEVRGADVDEKEDKHDSREADRQQTTVKKAETTAPMSQEL